LGRYTNSEGNKAAWVPQFPERIEFVGNIPIIEAGKTNKKLLREGIKKKLIKEGKFKE
jgi:acyl-CoA synthetase (AMP-forming)/AMP-acid ligase II